MPAVLLRPHTTCGSFDVRRGEIERDASTDKAADGKYY